MKSKTVATINHKRGMHLSPASIFAEKAKQFSSNITVASEENENEKWDGKRVIDLMSIGAVYKSKLVIEAEGDDAEEAIAELERLVNRNFGLTE